MVAVKNKKQETTEKGESDDDEKCMMSNMHNRFDYCTYFARYSPSEYLFALPFEKRGACSFWSRSRISCRGGRTEMAQDLRTIRSQPFPGDETGSCEGTRTAESDVASRGVKNGSVCSENFGSCVAPSLETLGSSPQKLLNLCGPPLEAPLDGL